VAERWCGDVARRDDVRLARRLDHQEGGEGVYRRDDGALLDDCFHCRRGSGVMARLETVPGTASQRARRPDVPDLVRSGLETLLGSQRLKALPALWCRDEALRQGVGVNAQPGRPGVCHRGAATRQGAREPGPIGPETRAQPSVRLTRRELASGVNGAMRALARAGVLEAQVPGLVDGLALAPTAHATGCGQGTRQRRLEETRGQAHASEGTGSGWHGLRWRDAVTKSPLAVKGGTSQAHDTHGTRALGTQARATLAGPTRRHKGVCAQGLLDGTDRWWLDQPGLRLVVPATTTMTVPVDARAQATAGAGLTGGRRVHPVRHGPGKTAATERLAPAVVGLPGLTTADQDGTPEPGRPHHRRDCHPHPLNAVVGRTGPGRA
jgi:hypothetical protein